VIEPDINERMARFAPSQNVGNQPDPVALEVLSETEADAPPPMAPGFDPIAVQIARESQEEMMATLRGASAVNPDQAARAQRIGQQVGIGQDVVLRNMAEMEREVVARQAIDRDLMRTAPNLARFLGQREFATIAHDDIDNLTKAERVFKWFAGIPKDVEEGLSRAVATSELGKMYEAQMRGVEPTWLDRVVIQSYNDELGRLSKESGFIESAANIVGIQAELAAQVPESVALGATMGGTWGLIGGPLAPATVPAGLAAGATVGLSVGFARAAYVLEAGNAYGSMVEEADAALRQRRDAGEIDAATYESDMREVRDRAKSIATGVGVVNAGLELVGLKMIAAPFREAFKGAVRRATAQAVTQQTTRAALGRAGTQYGLAIAGETGTEVMQEIVTVAGEELNSYGADLPLKMSTEEGRAEVAQRLVDTAIDTAKGMTLVGLPGPVVNYYVNTRKVAEARKAERFFTDLADVSKQDKVAERSPAAYERFLAAQAEGTQAETIYVDARTMQSVLQQAQRADPALTDEVIDEAMPGVRQELEKQLETGGDVTIPTATFGARLARTDLGRSLIPHMRLNPDALSVDEAVRYRGQMEERRQEAMRLMQEQDAAGTSFSQEAETVRNSIRTQIEAAGRSREEADIGSLLYRDFVVIQAARQGITPAEFQAQRGLRGVEGAAAGVPLEQAARETFPDFIAAWDKYNDQTDEWQTTNDLADELEALLEDGRAPAELEDALRKFREEQEFDIEVAGRGEMDTANEQLESAVETIAEKLRAAPGVMEQAATMDAEYMAAVERGDMETAQQQTDAAAERSFPESVVRGDGDIGTAGKILRVYHGSGAFIRQFMYEFTGRGVDQLGSGFYFTTDRPEAESYMTRRRDVETVKIGGESQPTVVEAYLDIRNPLRADKVGSITREQVRKFLAAAPEETRREGLENWGIDGDVPSAKVLDAYAFKDANIVRELFKIGNDFYGRNTEAFNRAIKDILGYDGVVQDFRADGVKKLHYVAFFPEQIKSADPVTYDEAGNVIPLSRRFDITSPRIFEQAAVPAQAGADAPGIGVSNENRLGFWPALRVRIKPDAALPEKPLILTGTTNKNATKQLANLDDILGRFPNAAESPEAWAQMLAYAFGTDDVPVPPYAFINDTNGNGSFDRLSTLTQGQIADATHGFDNAREFRRAYINNELDVITTGKLFLWSFLSRGVSPYTQESLFIDAFDGANEWIKKAASGKFTEADFDDYTAWAKSVAKKGSGQPGAGATHNLNAFGKNFLFKMGAIGEDGKSNLQRLHDMMSDPEQTGRMIRREFAKFGEGVGIDNKVVSFTLLVAGFNDVMVLDRVQVRQLWDDGRFSGTNLYDGVMDAEGQKIAGSSLNALTEGVRGILVYEAIERQLAAKINDLYAKLGRPQDASIGRYHWETWVAYSQQEAAHATLDAILLDAKGDDQAIAKVSGKQGEYGAYEYGAQYNRDTERTPWFRYTTPLGGTYDFSVPAFRQFLTEIKKVGNGVVPAKFKVTESGNAPWYTRPEVNQQRLEEQAAKWSDRGGGTGEGTRLVREAVADADAIRARSGAGVQPAGRGEVLEQAARGGFDFGRLKILLGERADATTFLHELVHFYMHTYTTAAAEGRADAQMLADLDILFRWLNVEGDTPEARLKTYLARTFEQRRPDEEAIAYSSEIYMWEGKAPSAELRGVFERMRTFFNRVYKSIRDELNAIYRREFGKDLPILTGEVRQVFDRMLAAPEAIRRQQAIDGIKPAFLTREQAGVDEAQWAEHQAALADAEAIAINDMTKASLRTVQWMSNARSRIVKEMQSKHDAKRKEVREEVAAQVRMEPAYRAQAYLRYGKFIDADGQEVEVDGPHKLDLETVKQMYELEPEALRPDVTAMARGKYGFVGKDGLNPDMIAETFGYSSGDQMIRAVMGLKPIKEAIDERTDAVMVERFSDLNSKAAVDAEVQKSLHNEARARFVAIELKFATKATAPTRVIVEAARQAARDIIAAKKVRDVRPGEHVAAEARASKDAVMLAGNTEIPDSLKVRYPTGTVNEALIRAKRQEMYQNQLAEEALRVKDEVDKDVKYLRRVLRDENVKRMGADAADQVAELLSRFDVAAVPLKILDRRKQTLLAWMEAKADGGIVPDIAPELLEAGRRVNYREMTVAEFRDMVSAVKQIEYVGKNERKLQLAEEKAEFEEKRDEIVTRIRATGRLRGLDIDPRSPLTNIGRTVSKLQAFAAAHLKAASIARVLDGGKDDGPLWNTVIRTANAAADMETRMRSEATAKLAEILKPVFALGNMGGKGMFFRSIDRSLNREARIAIALNMGNAGNMQRLLDGEGWNMAQVQPVLESLTAAEWNAVQQVWDFLETYRPLVAAKERRLYGKEPNWVEPQPLTVRTSDGQTLTLRGGYYPVKYDPVASDRVATFDEVQEAKDALRGTYTAATTRRSFTKARAEKVVGRPILYTLDAAFSGVNDVIHDLAWHEWLISTNRLLRDEKFANAVRETRGPEFLRQLREWAKANAAGDRSANVEGALSWLRQGISASGLGFNVMSAALQITGFNQSVVRVGAKWVGLGIAEFTASPFATSQFVREKSSFMAERQRTQFRELNELRNTVRGKGAGVSKVLAQAYLAMMTMQRAVDTPTWVGAYRKALAAGKDDATSVALADQAVKDSQGSGLTSDLAAIERGGPGLKLFTVFYSYMNTVYNMAAVQTYTSRGRGKLAADYVMLMVVPVVLGHAIKALLTPDAGDDDFDPEALARKLAAEELSFLMGTMVVAREFGGAAQLLTGAEGARMGYGGPAGVRAIGEAYNLATQTGQMEFDRAFVRSAINTLGAFTGLPSAQINRTIDGVQAILEGEVEGVGAVVAPLTGVKK
jgi:hypothetical protein